MPATDTIPFVSQAKSFVQFVTGDTDGALKTQENFARKCPGVSQVTSTVQLLAGDVDGAIETQKLCGEHLVEVAEGTPGTGHLIGFHEHLRGNHEEGNRVLKKANRSAIVGLSATAACVATGGVAAIPAAIGAGYTYDLSYTLADDKPYGTFQYYDDLVHNPNGGNVFDAFAHPALDGWGARGHRHHQRGHQH